MRDEKQQQPLDEGTLKPSYGKYLKDTEANPRDKFNEVMLAYGRRDPDAGKMLEGMKEDRGNFFSIGIGILQNPRGNDIAMSAQLIAQTLLLIAFQFQWHDMVNKMMRDAYDPRKGYPMPLALAFGMAMQKGYGEQVKGAIKGAFADGKNDEACTLLAQVDDKGLTGSFKEDLLRNAEEGDGTGRKNALAALSSLILDDKDVKATFVSLLDDWDDDTRGFCAGVLAKAKDEDVALRALEMLPDEHEPEMRAQLTAILEGNRETVLMNLLVKLAKAKKKADAEHAVKLLLRLEKKEKLKEMVGKMKSRLSDEVKDAIEKMLK